MMKTGLIELKDKSEIRSILQSDRVWGIYALADLDDEFFSDTVWYQSPSHRDALVFLFTGFDAPVLMDFGDGAEVARLLEELAMPKYYLTVTPHTLVTLKQWYHVTNEALMWRMVLSETTVLPEVSEVATLTLADFDAIEELYRDGVATRENPEFFNEQMLSQGFFRGIWRDKQLVAAAGTHQVSLSESIGTVGCVYTRRDSRGCGYAVETIAAVISELRRQGVLTIALNVKQDNKSAISVYERLGFRRHCAFYEGNATVQSGGLVGATFE